MILRQVHFVIDTVRTAAITINVTAVALLIETARSVVLICNWKSK